MTIFDWDNATVKVRVPVHHTATVTHEEIDLPLKTFKALLDGNDALPLAILDSKPKEIPDAD